MTTILCYGDSNTYGYNPVNGLRYPKDVRWTGVLQKLLGERIYNPRSIVCALFDNQLSNYWTSFGPYDEIFYYVRNDIKNIRNDLALMVIGERVNAKIGDFAAVSMELKTKNQIYSAMVIYGLLTYNNGQVFIPNKELMLKYDELLFRES